MGHLLLNAVGAGQICVSVSVFILLDGSLRQLIAVSVGTTPIRSVYTIEFLTNLMPELGFVQKTLTYRCT